MLPAAALGFFGEEATSSRRAAVLRPLLGVPATLLCTPLLASAEVVPPLPTTAAALKEDAVLEVVDGDTVKLAGYGRCRLIGVNTPETVAPRQREFGAPPDCFGPEASSLTKSLLPPGTKVLVELDAGPADKYGRELVYLYRAQDRLFINAELLKQGVARHMKVAPNIRYDEYFLKLEKEAVAGGKGLWKACPQGGTAPGGQATLVAGDGLNPGNLKNCKDFKTYEEAKQWFNAYYPLYGDIAKLDGDGDGKPCESLLKKK